MVVNLRNRNNDLNVNYYSKINSDDVILVKSKFDYKLYIIESNTQSYNVYTTDNNEIDISKYENFQMFEQENSFEIVDVSTKSPSVLYEIFSNHTGIVTRLLYKQIDAKISKSPKFDQVAFLCGTLTNFYFKSNGNTIIKMSYRTSFIPREDSRTMSEIKFINDADNKVAWHNPVIYETSGLVKNLSKEEIIIILQKDTEYVTKEEVKNILEL